MTRKKKPFDQIIATKVSRDVLEEFDRLSEEDRRTRADLLRIVILEHLEISRRLRQENPSVGR